MPISELQAKTMTEGTLTQVGDEFGDWGGRTLDRLIYDTAVGNDGNGVSHYFKAGDAAIDTGTLTSADVLKAADLRVLRTHFKTEGVQGFSQLNGRMVLALHPVQIQDLQGEAQSTSGNVTWASVNAHIPGKDGQNKILEGEGGALYGFEIKDSPTVQKVEVDTSVSGYKGLAFGKDAFVIAGMSDMQPKVRIVKPMDTNDPLQLVWKIACKFKGGFTKVDRKRSVLVYSYSA
jgi:N4-gp56 family major capsid protein